MPNYTTSRLIIVASNEVLEEIEQKHLTTVSDEFDDFIFPDFSTYFSCPQEIKGRCEELDWNVNNWSTKWSPCNCIKECVGSYFFDTPWNSPFNAIKRLSELYPAAVFLVKYSDEQIGTDCGEYSFLNGTELYNLHYNDNSEEAFKISFELIVDESNYLKVIDDDGLINYIDIDCFEDHLYEILNQLNIDCLKKIVELTKSNSFIFDQELRMYMASLDLYIDNEDEYEMFKSRVRAIVLE